MQIPRLNTNNVSVTFVSHINKLLVSDCSYSHDLAPQQLILQEKCWIFWDAKHDQWAIAQPVQMCIVYVNMCMVDVSEVKMTKSLNQNKTWAKNKNVSKYSCNGICNDRHAIQHVDSPQSGSLQASLLTGATSELIK